MSEQDFYQVLELSYDASPDEVRTAYERLRQLFEVDAVAAYTLFGEDESSQVRERLDTAFAVLSDEDRREEYDAEIGNEERAREDSRRERHQREQKVREDKHREEQRNEEPSLSHTASFDAHSEMTVSVAGPSATEEAPVAPSPATEAAAPASSPTQENVASSDIAPTAAASSEAPAPSEEAHAAKSPDAEDGAGLADNHEDGQYSGGVLQRLREGKALTIGDIAKKTKISLAHLRAIEGNAYDKLPARVYVRGFVMQYARCLGLPPDRTADSYLQIYDRYFQTKS